MLPIGVANAVPVAQRACVFASRLVRSFAVCVQVGRPSTCPIVASSNASSFKGTGVAARVKRTVRAARVTSRRTAVVPQAKVGCAPAAAAAKLRKHTRRRRRDRCV